MDWDNYVPDAVTPLTAVPLAWHQLIKQNLPVLTTRVTTTQTTGAAVSLPAAFTTILEAESGVDSYAVLLSYETNTSSQGNLYIANKTTSGFDVMNDGTAWGDTVVVTVFYLP
jgi:hypothetical protein